MSDYRQALLRRGSRERVCWVPSKLAKVGRYLRLLDEDGWLVVKAYRAMDGAFVRGRESDYRRQRQASDA